MRIDLGDVEHAVAAHPAVRASAVVAADDGTGELELVAFVVPAAQRVDQRALRADLVAALPRNMVPQRLIELTALPLNPNGKIDRKSLTAQAADGAGSRAPASTVGAGRRG
jgi:acyl-coenzyme A synthetase/AMP-(fatty) acid ligase